MNKPTLSLGFLFFLLLAATSSLALPQTYGVSSQYQNEQDLVCQKGNTEELQVFWSKQLNHMTSALQRLGIEFKVSFQNKSTWASLCSRYAFGEWSRFSARFARIEPSITWMADRLRVNPTIFRGVTIIWTDGTECEGDCHFAGEFSAERRSIEVRIDGADPAATQFHELFHLLNQAVAPSWFNRDQRDKNLNWFIELLAIAATDRVFPLDPTTKAERVFWKNRRQGSLSDVPDLSVRSVNEWTGFTLAYYRYLKLHIPEFYKLSIQNLRSYSTESVQGDFPGGLPSLSPNMYPYVFSSPDRSPVAREFQNWHSVFTHFVVSLFSKAHVDPHRLTESGSSAELHLTERTVSPLELKPGTCATVPPLGFLELLWLEADLRPHTLSQETGVNTLFWRDHRGSPSTFLTARVSQVHLDQLMNDQSSRFLSINPTAVAKKVCLH